MSGGVARATSTRPAPVRREAPKVAPWRERRRGVQAVTPKHVAHCSRNGSKSWWVYTWRKGDPTNVQRAPYCCNSWRHSGDCARHEAAVTFTRIRDACSPLEASGWVFLVLTLDRDGRTTGKPWTDARDAYRELSTMSRKFLKRLNRECEREGWERPGSRWVAVVEAHRSGMPHVNFMVYAPDLARALANARARKLADGATEREAILLDGALLAHATDCGWGHQSTAEQCKSRDALIGYVTKLTTSDHVHATAGEIAKLTQLPLNAPQRFRRLRAGKGFLAPRNKNAEVTGTLVRRRRELDGSVTVLPLHNVKDHDARALVVTCCYHEESIAYAELQGRAVYLHGEADAELMRQNPGLLPGFVLLPMVSVWQRPPKPKPLPRETSEPSASPCEVPIREREEQLSFHAHLERPERAPPLGVASENNQRK